MGGWSLLLVCFFAPFDQYLGSQAWRQLFVSSQRPAGIHVLLASWTGSAINTLIPIATIGGELVKARLLILWSYPSDAVVSSVIVDKTVQAISVLVWAVLGIILLASTTSNNDVIFWASIGAALLAVGVAGFVWIQVKGSLGIAARLANRSPIGQKWIQLVQNADTIDHAIRVIYLSPGPIFIAILLRLCARLILVGEVLLVMYFMEVPITFIDALLLKGIVVGIRGVGFAIPGSYGVQEGSYILVGALIGFTADVMLAVSIATRAREILPSIPFLFFWQHVEGKNFLKRDQNNN